MRHLRSQRVSSAGLLPHGSTAWSHRLTPRFSEALFSIPHSSRFGGGCRDQVRAADEDNYATITAAGMAGHDVAASGRALTNDSSRLADMRVWLEEKRHRSPAWSGRPGTAGSGDRVGEQAAEACVASADRAAE